MDKNGTAQCVLVSKPFKKVAEERTKFKVVDSCWISSTEWSDTFRSSFVYGKEQESRKKIYHNRANESHFPEEV